MLILTRLAIAPALAVAISGITLTTAHATTVPLTDDAVTSLAVASCQLDPLDALTAEQMNPVVLAQADVDVVPGEISAHLYRAEVTTVAGDAQECTFGVLHRDAQLAQVQHVGDVTLARVDSADATAQSAVTEIGLGNMGRGSAVDPTTAVPLTGFLTPLDGAGNDPTYTISLRRKAIEVVQVAVDRAHQDAAGRLLQRQLRAAAQLERKQLKAASGKHADKTVAAAKRAYNRQVAAAQVAYDRATAPKSVSRPVSRSYTVTGTLSVSP